MSDQSSQQSSLKERLRQLPDPVKWILGLAAVLLVFVLGSALGEGRGMFFVFLVILLLVVVGGYLLWGWWVKRKKSRQIAKALEEHSGVAPQGVSDEQVLKDVERFRQKFAEGIREYRRRGKNLYSLPWYVIIGESGSGKTQAIRHSDIGFPEGLHDELPGSGGTINMDWFFTEEAVILDTAGRILTQQVEAGASDEWREFLMLLHEHRPRVPFNGLLLVIPADSLQRDPEDEAKRKARLLLRRMQMIQSSLDVRFPVFVVITKSDLIHGFREFFDGIKDAEAQHQILGWSNPDPLDSPYDPRAVQQHLDTVVERLKRRRLALLGQTEPERLKLRRLGLLPPAELAMPDGRRMDEVDALYAFPNQFAAIGKPLQIYLQTLFTTGTWSFKPLFVRGIYFTSSMREGRALDLELIDHGVPPEALAGEHGWVREKAYFLTDLFREKIFREKGLVTPVSNTRWLIRTSQVAFYAVGSVALVLWLIIAAVGMSGLRESGQLQSKAWAEAADGWKKIEAPAWNETEWLWRPVISTNLFYLGDDPRFNVLGHTLAEFHALLRDYAEKKVETNWMFRPVSWLLRPDINRKQAQRIVFEAGVLKPLVFATRQKILTASLPPFTEKETQDRRSLSEAVRALLLLESNRRTTINRAEADDGFFTLLRFLGSGQTSGLAKTMEWTYSNGDGKGKWAPAFLSEGRSLSNSVVASGLQTLFASLNIRLDVTNTLSTCDALLKRLREVRNAEAELSNAIKLSKGHEDPYKAYAGAVERLTKELVKERKDSGILGSSPYSIATVYRRLEERCNNDYILTFGRIEDAVTNQANLPLFKETMEWLKERRNTMPHPATSSHSDAGRLDGDFLAPYSDYGGVRTDKRSLFEVRAEEFGAFSKLFGKIDFPLVKPGIGSQEMRAEDVKDLCRQMNVLKRDFAVTNFPPHHTTVLRPLMDRLNPYFPLAQALVATDQLATVTFKFVKSEDQMFDRGKTRKIEATLPDHSKTNSYTDARTNDVALGTCSVADQYILNMYQRFGDASELSRRLDSGTTWSAIYLVHKYNANRPSDGGTNWLVRIPFDRGLSGWPETNGSVVLRLEFSRPLPSLDEWPQKR